MNLKVLNENFLYIEKEFDLVNWLIDEIPIWQLIRFELYNKIESDLITGVVTISDKKANIVLNGLLNLIKNFIRKRPKTISKNIDLLVFNHPRRVFSEGYYNDIYTDSFLNDLDEESIVIERFFKLGHLNPSKTKNLYYLDYIEFPSRFVSLLNHGKLLTHSDKLKIKKIEDFIVSRLTLDNLDLEVMIKRTLARYKFLHKRIDNILEKLKPKIILVVVSYTLYTQILIEKAKKRNIPVCELQHGIAGSLHLAYNYIDYDNVVTFPDYFLAWGNYWIKDTRMPISRKNIKIIGFPYLEKYANKIVECKPNQILVLSQMRDEIADFTSKLAVALPNYNILYKAHPAEYLVVETKYSFLRKYSNISIINNDNKKLYELISESQFVLGVNSTALGEALAFRTNILILKIPGWEVYEDIEPTNELTFISSIIEAKKFILNYKINNTEISNRNFYFMKNSISNMKVFLNSLYKK